MRPIPETRGTYQEETTSSFRIHKLFHLLPKLAILHDCPSRGIDESIRSRHTVAHDGCRVSKSSQEFDFLHTAMEEDLTVIKSLIAISSGGLALSKIEREFREMNGSNLNYRKYGFQSLEEMLQSSKDIALLRSSSGIICHVNDSKMSHVTSLVDRTKKSKPKKKSSRSRTAYSHTSRGAYSSPQRYGARRGAYSSPQRYGARRGSTNDPNRKPFYPVNRTQYDGGYRNRPQSVGRLSSSTSSKNPSQNAYQNCRYQPPSSLSNSHAFNSNYARSQKQDHKPVQSSSIGSSVGKVPKKDVAISEWSSDSSENEDQPCTVLSSIGWTSRPVEKTLPQVQLPKSSSSSLNTSKAPNGIPASVQVKTSSNRISDWSSDSGSSSSMAKVPKRTVVPPAVKRSSVPVQNAVVSSTSKPVENGSARFQSKSDSSSDWSTDSSDHESDVHFPPKIGGCSKPASVGPVLFNTPLMVGGVGRGRSRPQVDLIKPGRKDANQSQSKVVVGGSPSKRETSTTISNGLSSLLIKVHNNPAAKCQQPKTLKMSQPKSNIAGYDFIGDFLLRKVGEVSAGLKFPAGGLCRSRATIMECLDAVTRNGSTRPVVLMIGMTDILKGASFEDMKHHMTLLLEKLSSRNIVLLTLPVLPIFMTEYVFDKELAVLETFNRWLLSLKLPNTIATIETEKYLYCDSPFYTPRYGSVGLETFSEEGCWVVFDEIKGAI